MSKQTPSDKSTARELMDARNLLARARNPGPDPFEGVDWAKIHAEQEAEELANASPIPVMWPCGD